VAIAEAMLIALFLMHIKGSSRLLHLAAVAGVMWLLILISLTWPIISVAVGCRGIIRENQSTGSANSVYLKSAGNFRSVFQIPHVSGMPTMSQ
jgi:hypothetical protein